jgi:hypothetical protein
MIRGPESFFAHSCVLLLDDYLGEIVGREEGREVSGGDSCDIEG